jgi:type I restriction enzyme S subunit
MVSPVVWKEVRLGDIYDVKSSKRVLQSDWRPSGVPFYRGREITELSERGTVQNDLFIDRHLFETLRSRYGVPGSGDILVSAIGTIGNAFLVRGDHEFYFKDASVLWLSSRSAVDGAFVQQWMQSAGFLSQLPTGNGTTVDTLTIGTLAGLRVPLPPLKEQEAIAEALSDADAAIEALDGLIAKKRDVKHAAMQQLLTGRTRLPGYSGEWQQLGFDRILQRSRGPGKAIPAGEYTSVGVLPIIDQSQAAVAGWTDRVDLRVHCPARGVIVFGDHTRVVKFVGTDFVVGADGTQVLIPSGDGDARFLSYLLQQAEIPNTGYNRHFKFLRDLTLSCPAGAEQRAIAEVLSDMDSEIEALVAERDKIRLVKQGMMQELLSGRVRLV